MKRLITVLLTTSMILMIAVGAFAFAPGDGVYSPGSSEFYNAGRALTRSFSTPVISHEFARLVEEKEATLTQGNGLLRAAASNSSHRISSIVQYSQENSYYCGPAAVKSVLAGEGNTTVTQKTLAGKSYLKTDTYSSTPWYITNGSSFSDYPVYNTLRAFTTFIYVPYPSGSLGTPPPSDGLKTRIMSTISSGHGVVANGQSAASSSAASHMPGYTTSNNIAHWIAVDGYKDSGNTIWIVDPINGCSGISWNGNVSRYYSITLAKFTAFVAPRGIFW